MPLEDIAKKQRAFAHQQRELALEIHRQVGINIAKEMVVHLKKKYFVSKVVLFGSMTRKIRVGSDIDLAVWDLPPVYYFQALGELSLMSSFPVDLVDIDDASECLKNSILKGWEL